MQNSRPLPTIEIAALIAIVGVLAVILYRPFVTARDQELDCQANVKQLAMGVMIYVIDHDGYFPFSIVPGDAQPPECVGEAWGRLVFPYVRSREAFICPTHGKGPQFANTECDSKIFFMYDTSYAINQGASNQEGCGWSAGWLGRIGNQAETVLITEATGGGHAEKRAHAGIGGPPGKLGPPYGPAVPNYWPSDPCQWWGEKWNVIHYCHDAKSNTAFVDGHVKALSKDELERVGPTPSVPEYTMWDWL